VNRIPYAARKTNPGKEAAWETAFRQAKLEYVRPYAMRHSFAGWGLTLKMDPNRLVYLMGHSTKKVIYERYENT
jgi:integrase